MQIHEIRGMPTTVDIWGNKVHESVLRSYQIVEKLRYLIEIGTPHDLMLDILKEMNAPISRTLTFPDGKPVVLDAEGKEVTLDVS